MLAIQIASGIPYPWYFRHEPTPTLESRVSLALLSPNGLLLNALHVPVFAVLTVLWVWALRAWSGTARKALVVGFAISVLFAVANELSQVWVPTRFATVDDLLLNVAGATLAATLLAYARAPTSL